MVRRPVFVRYLLFQLPGWIVVIAVLLLLRDYLDLPFRTAALLFGLWVLKDLVLFPLLRHAYEVDTRTVVERLIGERGTTARDLAPAGYVRVRGELWRAEVVRGAAPIPNGRPVVVTAVRGSLLIVAPPDGPPPH